MANVHIWPAPKTGNLTEGMKHASAMKDQLLSSGKYRADQQKPEPPINNPADEIKRHSEKSALFKEGKKIKIKEKK